jgi:hypothetical protein
MNWIFRLIFFNIFLNIGVGIMLITVPAFRYYESGGFQLGNIQYYTNSTTQFVDAMNGSVAPGGSLQNQGDTIYRVLDMINLGFVAKFLNIMKYGLFGFWELLEGMLGGMMSTDQRLLIFGTLKGITTIGYALGAFWMWTGRSFSGGTA